MEKYATPTQGVHGTKGPIGVSYGAEWMPLIDTYLEAADDALQCGIIPDYNDGNVVGGSVAQFNIVSGRRITSADAFLKSIPKNLTISTEVLVDKIVFDGDKAVAVEFTKDGKKSTSRSHTSDVGTAACTDEIILSCGTIGSPTVLFRSGITNKDNPAIGKNLTDHLILSLEFELYSNVLSHHHILEDPKLAAEAEEEYRLTRTGNLVKFGGSSGVIFPKLESVYTSKEFDDISDEEVKEFLTDPGRPTTEIWFMVYLHLNYLTRRAGRSIPLLLARWKRVISPSRASFKTVSPAGPSPSLPPAK
jgi:choline dehydrogenase-like flavoprotein